LTGNLLKFVAEDAGSDVGRAPGRIRHDHLDGPVWIFLLRDRCARAKGECGGEHCHQDFHAFLQIDRAAEILCVSVARWLRWL
jgi:hypothetical protein